MRAYKDEELKLMEMVIKMAQVITEDTITKHKLKDGGTCMGGAGIAVKYLGPKKKNPVTKVIVHNPFQGGSPSQLALQPALKYLQAHGIECFYEYGWVD